MTSSVETRRENILWVPLLIWQWYIALRHSNYAFSALNHKKIAFPTSVSWHHLWARSLSVVNALTLLYSLSLSGCGNQPLQLNSTSNRNTTYNYIREIACICGNLSMTAHNKTLRDKWGQTCCEWNNHVAQHFLPFSHVAFNHCIFAWQLLPWVNGIKI